MKRILLFTLLAISLICFTRSDAGVIMKAGTAAGPTYVHNLPCTDNAANTVVTNNGTGANWTASVNTDTFGDGTSFLMDANNDNAVSAANWTAEKLIITWDMDHVNATASGTEYHVLIDDGDFTVEQNEFILYRSDGSDEFTFRSYGNGDGERKYKVTTDNTGDTNWHEYILTIDATASPWGVVLEKCDEDGSNCVTLSWGAWDGNSSAAVFNNPLYIANGSNEPKTYYKDFRVQDNS